VVPRSMRRLVPWLGILALLMLFFKLPDTPNIWGLFGCKTCSSPSPYVPLAGAAYFTLLVATSLLFPRFPGPRVARAGLVWSLLLAVGLTAVGWPRWCIGCLIAHVCHLLIWTIWAVVPAPSIVKLQTTTYERLCMVLFAPVPVVALFACLNLTFMAYGIKPSHPTMATGLHVGDAVPDLALVALPGTDLRKERILLNFIAPNCPYCKEQLTLLTSMAPQLAADSIRLINVSPILPADRDRYAASFEWAEDRDGQIGNAFKIAGYPTLFVVGADGKIAAILPGVPAQLKERLLGNLN
jgi:thiol-disulfide isomerase/thioredoxin